MRRYEDEKVRYRPPLLEEPCAQTLSGKTKIQRQYYLRKNAKKKEKKQMKTLVKNHQNKPKENTLKNTERM